MKAALLYAREFAWRVVPLNSLRPDGSCDCAAGADCRTPGKHPRIGGWQKAATSDADQITEWVSRWPAGNVGVATGAGSGFFALDVDTTKGGAESLARWVAQHGPLPATVQARTGSGGSHYLFKCPAFPVRNSNAAIAPGIDIRGEGGQIVVAPSVSSKGAYKWVSPPWSTALAEAPAWLLALLAASPTPEVPSAPQERPAFPPASPAVLADAREALRAHGPAIDGEAGGVHTVQASAILTHDYALTDEEAWPLLLEWNMTCVPPWTDRDLRTPFRNGRAYGKAPYGCKRTADLYVVLKAEIAAFIAAATGVDPMVAFIPGLRERMGQLTDPAQHATILRDLQGMTGLKPHEMGMPKFQRPAIVVKAGEILMSVRLHEMADEATLAIAPLVFQRAGTGVLCEVVTGDRSYIHDLESARIQDIMSRCSTWLRADEKGEVSALAPERVATVLSARRVHTGVRELMSVTNAPIFLADGTILQAPGYSEQAKVYLDPNVYVQVADRPTLADARAAVDQFRDLVSDFQFASPADFSSWLAAVLSPLVKSATGNAPGPLVCVSASSPGAGKTLLTDLVSAIVTGGDAEIRPYNPRDKNEWDKKLTSFVKMASPVSVFDNCNGPIGDEALDRLITSSTWSDRILGGSEAPPLQNVTTWLATGNNIEPQGDTVRRVLMVRILVTTERPQERTGFKRPLLKDWALENRASLLSSALTLLRAYHVAGRPAQALAPWGSFTAWSSIVRGALVWAGCADPFLTQQRASSELNEPENDAHDFWLGVVEASSDGSPATISAMANARDASAVLGCRDQITPIHLRKFISRFVDKPRQGKKIVKSVSGGTAYYVEVI